MSTRVHTRQATAHDNSACQKARTDHEDVANDSNVAQTEDDQDTHIQTKKRKMKKMITGTTQKLMALVIVTLESLPKTAHVVVNRSSCRTEAPVPCERSPPPTWP